MPQAEPDTDGVGRGWLPEAGREWQVPTPLPAALQEGGTTVGQRTQRPVCVEKGFSSAPVGTGSWVPGRRAHSQVP